MMNKSNNQKMKISIIGGRQAGKTTLALGLKATNSPDLTVDYGDDTTLKYLTARRNELDNGQWPSGTTGLHQLVLALSGKDKEEATLLFYDYAGEIFEDTEQKKQFDNQIGGSDGIAILLNPAMDALKDAASRNNHRALIERVIREQKKQKCKNFALVITASDRLNTDLKDKKEMFGEFFQEIENRLSGNKLNYKRFYVTITGELESQDKPSLARGDKNTAHKPFVWLIDEIRRQQKEETIKQKTAKIMKYALTLVTVMAALLSINVYVGVKIDKKQITDLYNKFNAAVKDFDRDKTVTYQASETPFANVKNTKEDLERHKAKGINRKYHSEKISEVMNTFAQCERNHMNAKREALKIEMITLIENRRKTLGDYDGKHGLEVLNALCNIPKITTSLPEFAEEVKEINRKTDDRIIDEFKFLLDEYGKQVASKKLLEEIKSLRDKLSQHTWFVLNDTNMANRRAKLKENIYMLLQSKEIEYDDKQKKICDDFIKNTYTGDTFTRDMLNEAVKFYNLNKGNKYIDEVKRDACRRVEDQTEVYVKELSNNKSQNTFDSMRKLLREIKKYPDFFNDSWVYKFSNACSDKERGNIDSGLTKAFPLTVTITKIEGKIDWESYRKHSYGVYFGCNLLYKEGKETRKLLEVSEGVARAKGKMIKKEDNGKWMYLWNGVEVIDTGEFDKISIAGVFIDDAKGNMVGQFNASFNYSDSVSVAKLKSQGSQTFEFPYKLEDCKNPKVSLRITTTVSGETIQDLLDSAKK